MAIFRKRRFDCALLLRTYMHDVKVHVIQEVSWCCFPFRDKREDEVFNVGREFDERYHWHSLKPLSDDYDRKKKSIEGKDKKKCLMSVGCP